jgi:putative sterol carrier protein
VLDELTARVTELVESKEAVGFDVKFDLGSTGVIFVSGESSPMQVSNSDSPADTVFKVSAEDLAAMLDRTLAPTMAYMQGKLKVDGDLSQAMQLSSIFS